MRIGYFGSPAVSARLLQAIIEANQHEILFVVSNPDRPHRRSARPVATEVSKFTLEQRQKKISLFRPTDLRDRAFIETLGSFQADIFVVFAFGSLLPSAIFSLPPMKTINLHASLLPELRGASPIESAILRGLDRSGWSVQYVSKKLDAGEIITQREVAMDPNETSAELMERMLPKGIKLLLETLEQLSRGEGKARPQDDSRATFCKRIDRQMARINWAIPAKDIHNFIRALNPRPVAWTCLGGQILRIYRSRLLQQKENWQEREKDHLISERRKESLPGENSFRPSSLQRPGTLLLQPRSSSLQVCCQDRPIELLELQMEGKKRMAVKDFLNGYRLPEMVVV